MIDIYVLGGTRVMTNGSMISIGENPGIENVFQLNPGKIRIRHFTFRGRNEDLIKKVQERRTKEAKP